MTYSSKLVLVTVALTATHVSAASSIATLSLGLLFAVSPFVWAAMVSAGIAAYTGTKAHPWIYVGGFVVALLTARMPLSLFGSFKLGPLLFSIAMLPLGYWLHMNFRRTFVPMFFPGPQSNQPLHPTPTGGPKAADGAGERRR